MEEGGGDRGRGRVSLHSPKINRGPLIMEERGKDKEVSVTEGEPQRWILI